MRDGATAQSVSVSSLAEDHGVPAAHGENAGRIIRCEPATSAGNLRCVPADGIALLIMEDFGTSRRQLCGDAT